ncbi:acyl-CoA dehydrogenase [Rhodobacterales bacterium HKCCE2091]|nr:acyl-CoA dehydrogenase [Rhodobacterales bacterium HKCCE2091]
MDLTVTAEAEARGKAARAFAAERLNDGLEERDRRGRHDDAEWRDRWRAAAEAGLLRLGLPEADGGDGSDLLAAAHVLHELGAACRDNGFLLALNAQLWTIIRPLAEFGSPAQKREILPRILSGEWIGADAVTELASGSDAMALATRAVRHGDGYVIDGEKAFIGMAPACDIALVFARTSEGGGPWGVSVFLVDVTLAGVHRDREIDKAGLRTIPTGFIAFEGVRVPGTARLGPEGAGSAIFARSSEWERQMIFAAHVGAMRRQLAACIAHARARVVFGKPIAQQQSVSNRLAEMRVRYETCLMMQRRAAWQMQTGTGDGADAAITKLYLSEAILASSLDAVRIMGGAGCLWDADAARDLRDAVGGVIYGGTSDIQRNIIAAHQDRGGFGA